MERGINMNQSVRKALTILDLFIDNEELSLHEITKKAKLSKPTTYRLLSTLETAGLLYKKKDGPHDSRYGLGLKLLELGELVADRLELRKIALPYMENLAKEVNEVVHLVIINQQEATYIEKVNSRRALSLHTNIGRSTPLYVGSGPKMLLAFLSNEEQDIIIGNKPLKTLRYEPIEKRKLKEELRNIKENHYAISVGEQDADTTGVSFPIFNHEHKLVAALAVSGLSTRFIGEKLEVIKQKGKQSALEISNQLGYKSNV